jgi:hypothetical protein
VKIQDKASDLCHFHVSNQASCRASGITMSMEESTTRRAALGAILAGAFAPRKSNQTSLIPVLCDIKVKEF